MSFGESRFQKAFEEVGNSPNLMEAFGGSSSGMFYGESSHVASPKFLPPSSTQPVPPTNSHCPRVLAQGRSYMH